jgi:hypothetical protein
LAESDYWCGIRFAAIFLRSLVGLKGCSVAGGVMASETELFYLVLLTLLTLVIHLILSMKHRRDDKHSQV